MSVQIVPIDESNWKLACGLEVLEEQLPHVCHFSPPAAEALAVAYVRPGGFEVRPFGIQVGERLVGFFLLCGSEDPREVWLKFFFVDRSEQGKGYGRDALAILNPIAAGCFPSVERILLTIHPENDRARYLYARSGFVSTERDYLGHPIWSRALGSDKLEG